YLFFIFNAKYSKKIVISYFLVCIFLGCDVSSLLFYLKLRCISFLFIWAVV
ncbi:hypothetical protein L9F63_020251, partial [Diploptera punctata]